MRYRQRRRWPVVFGGVLVGVLAALGLELYYRSRLEDVTVRLVAADHKLRELGPVKLPVDAYEKDRARFEAQLRWIDEEKARQRCPGLVLAGLDLDRRTAPVEALSLDGTTLALVGLADSDAELKALATSVRGTPWTRVLRAGSARDGRRLRFGLLATVEAPACPASERPAASGAEKR